MIRRLLLALSFCLALTLLVEGQAYYRLSPFTTSAANVTELRNGTSGQNLYIYNTWANGGTDYERAELGWTANLFGILVGAGGTGSSRSMAIGTGSSSSGSLTMQTSGTNRWSIQGSTGHFVTSLDNTYDIGQDGATRPRHYYGGGNIKIAGEFQNGAASAQYWTGRSAMFSLADGHWNLTNNANNTGVHLQVGLPTIGACGTGSPAVTALSTDVAGELTVGSGGTLTSCVVNFASTWPQIPRCVAAVSTTTAANTRSIGMTSTTSVLTMTPSAAFAANDKVWWLCISAK